MIKKEDIKDILASIQQDWKGATEKDIAFLVLCDTFADRKMAYRIAYNRSVSDIETFCNTPRMKKLQDILRPYGIGLTAEVTVTREQNKAELINMLKRIKEAAENKKLDTKEALTLEKDIRIKLNDKFEMDESHEDRRIIVVPQKHDLICPHTNRECSKMPTKEACMQYYGLKDNENA